MERPLWIAHRGWRTAGPENSRRSVVEAFLRCDGAEVDVIVTADGLPILRHDERLHDGTPVRSLSLAALRRRESASEDDVPVVESVLDAIGGVGAAGAVLNLELKVPGAARALSRRLGARVTSLPRIVFTSFYAAEALDAIALFPLQRVGLLVSKAPIALVPAGVALLAVRHTVAPAVRAAYPSTPIWCWTVNTEAALASARSAGAQAIISDDVERTRSIAS